MLWHVMSQELEVRSFNHPYSLKTKSPQCHYVVMTILRNDNMKFSVLGFRSDIRIELQAPVVMLLPDRFFNVVQRVK